MRTFERYVLSIFIGLIAAALILSIDPAVKIYSASQLDPAPERTAVVVSRDGSAPYKLVGSGDSILSQVKINEPDHWIISEPCRAPFLSGCDFRASTVTEVTWLIKSSQPGGYVLVQDGGLGDRNGRQVTLTEWRLFVQKLIDIVPNDRTLIWVSPGSHQSAEARQIMGDRAGVAYQVFLANPQQPLRVINLRTAADAWPGFYKADGLHLSLAGQTWLANQVQAIVP